MRILTVLLLAVLGLPLLAGGGYLLSLGGSAMYVLSGLWLLLVAWAVLQRRRWALGTYALWLLVLPAASLAALVVRDRLHAPSPGVATGAARRRPAQQVVKDGLVQFGAVHAARPVDQVVRLIHQHSDAPLVEGGQTVEQGAHVEVVVVIADHHVRPTA